jgi:hypothetical protein
MVIKVVSICRESGFVSLIRCAVPLIWRKALEMDLWHAAIVVLGEATGRIIDGGLEKRYIGAPTQKGCGMTAGCLQYQGSRMASEGIIVVW